MDVFSDDNYFLSARFSEENVARRSERRGKRKMGELARLLIYGEKFMPRRHCIQMSGAIRRKHMLRIRAYLCVPVRPPDSKRETTVQGTEHRRCGPDPVTIREHVRAYAFAIVTSRPVREPF